MNEYTDARNQSDQVQQQQQKCKSDFTYEFVVQIHEGTVNIYFDNERQWYERITSPNVFDPTLYSQSITTAAKCIVMITYVVRYTSTSIKINKRYNNQ